MIAGNTLTTSSILSGTGSPEGKITAPVGTVYADTTARMGAIQWIKTTGTGDTGWRVQHGDTGWRDISSLIPGHISGKLRIKRDPKLVHLDFSGLQVEDPTGSFHQWDGLLPSGFRPELDLQYVNLSPIGSSETIGPVRVSQYGQVVVYSVKPQKRMSGSAIFSASSTWPMTSPGIPD